MTFSTHFELQKGEFMKTEKIYSVTFRRYTNCLNDAVSDYDENSLELDPHTKYIDIGKDPCLVRESDLSYFQKFGGGFDSIKFVGIIHIPDDQPVIHCNPSDEDIRKLKEIVSDPNSTGSPILTRDYVTIN